MEESPYFSGYKELKFSKPPFLMSEKKMMTNAVTDIVRALETGREPRSTARDGLKALELICAFKSSFKTGERVLLPLKNRDMRL